jgi:glutathione S-transferase
VVGKAIFGWAPVDQEHYNNSIKELKEAIKVLNIHLQGKDYLVGNRLTIADIVAAVALILPN